MAGRKAHEAGLPAVVAGLQSGVATVVKDTFFRPGSYYIEFEDKERTGVLVVTDFHRSPQAALDRVNHPRDDDEARCIGVAVSTGSRSKPVGMGQILFPGAPLRDELRVTPLKDFTAFVREVEDTAPEVFEDPSLTREVLEHTGSETRHVLCADVLGYKKIVARNLG